MLHENSAPQFEIPATEALGDEEEFAERFRREYVDAAGERRRAQVAVGGGKGTKEDEGLKGPKLGGSRSMRVKVREVLLKQQEGKK